MTTDLDAELIGISGGMASLRDEIALGRTSDAKVLISGDSGVDKGRIAQAIHQSSRRSSRPFVSVNCAALSETLLQSQLFGHVKGSFPGANRDKVGTLEVANEGTVFLNDIGETTPGMQALLLRFFETGEVQRLGDLGPPRRVNVRVIAATSQNLIENVKSGRFREDLFYRLNVIHLVVPPLSERREDVPILVEYFLSRLREGGSGRVAAVSSAAMSVLTEYSWPGNVRELRLVMERLVVTTMSEVADVEDLPPRIRVLSGGQNWPSPPGLTSQRAQP
jgi:DNA-binding NtrC family response regulator